MSKIILLILFESEYVKILFKILKIIIFNILFIINNYIKSIHGGEIDT